MFDFLSEATAIKDQIVTDRRWLHQHPECGYDLPETTAYVKARLEGMGYRPQELIEGAGLVATVGDTSKKCYLLRADMDALPENEETELPFASANGRMHACGHDLHTSMLLGAARLLKNHEEDLPGCVKLMFQPDEEAVAKDDVLGCERMIRAGVLEDPKVSAASGCHVTPEVPDGQLGYYAGTVTYSVDDVDVVITGKTTHGAATYEGVDPINVMCHIHLALQEVLARETSPQEPVVLSMGVIEGGTAANIIPETCHMLGTLRTTSEDTRLRLRERIATICQGTAEAFGATADVRFLRPCSTVYNDPDLVDQLVTAYEAGTGRKALRMDRPFSGSDDFGIMSHAVPSAYLMLGAIAPDAPQVTLHNPHIVFDEDVLPPGAAMHASAAWGWLEQSA